MARNYRRERRQYYGYGPRHLVTPIQRLRRRHKHSRNKARARLRKRCTQTKCMAPRKFKQMDVDHIDGNPLNNSLSNLRLIPINKNRSYNGKRKKKKHP